MSSGRTPGPWCWSSVVSLISAPVRASKNGVFCTSRYGACERALLFWSLP